MPKPYGWFRSQQDKVMMFAIVAFAFGLWVGLRFSFWPMLWLSIAFLLFRSLEFVFWKSFTMPTVALAIGQLAAMQIAYLIGACWQFGRRGE